MFNFVILVNIICVVNCVFYKSNSSDLTKCDISYSRSGSTYKEFYPIHTQENGTFFLDFHFAVLATSDAHILLAESDNVSKNDSAYEVVIGAGGNTFCDIRRMQKSEVKQSVRIKGLLSALDPHFFWLHITKSGVLEVGREGDNASFIDWMDPEPLPVKFISFSTWSGIEAKWYFNCDRSENQEEIEKRLTALDKLRRNLLKPYDPLVRPVMNQSTVTQILMAMDIEYLDLDEQKSSIELQGTTFMKWHDEKLHWDPIAFENITQIHAARNEVWTPEFTCYSTVSTPIQLPQNSILTVDNRGEVLWKTTFHLKAFCDESQMVDWPRNIHICKVLFGFAVDYGSIVLNFSDTSSSFLQQSSSQWLVLEASVVDIEPTNDSSTNEPRFGVYFEIRRSSVVYGMVFFVPLLVIGTCLLFLWWVSPRGNTKLLLGCSQVIIGIIMLLALAHFVPHKPGGVPLLIVLYSWCLGGSLLAVMLSVLVTNLYKKKHSKPLPHVICNVLTKRVVKVVLWLPNIVMPEDYGDLDISLSLSNVSRAEDKDHQFWILLVIAIERVAFLFYTIFIVTITVKYVISCF
ncbi:acetylcholine receptor subunit beta-type lev-1-like [Euwallacea similis]|uniref:acetylcholine receptor subunit beta-type lev-1-like n=1 Tax=Euwallacea similis TaxID=1736056 RepID=UPI003450A9BB